MYDLEINLEIDEFSFSHFRESGKGEYSLELRNPGSVNIKVSVENFNIEEVFDSIDINKFCKHHGLILQQEG